MKKNNTIQTVRIHLNTLIEKIQDFSLPGFEGLPLRDVIIFFFHGLRRGSLVTRASAIAFNLLLAILPSTILVFTLIPFIPIHNFQGELLQLIRVILPENVFSFLESTIVEVITEKSAGLLFIMFGATLVFSSNGVHALYSAFNVSIHELSRRNWFSQRSVAILLVFIITAMLTAAVFLFIFSQAAAEKMVGMGLIRTNLTYYVIRFGKWLILMALVFLTISFIYYFAPAMTTRWRFLSAGSLLATVLFFLSSLGFSWFVKHFGRFNSLYGSMGTLIVILILLYFNSISILIGFELNASIKSANREKNGNEHSC